MNTISLYAKIFAICICISLPANANDATKLKACAMALNGCEALSAEQDKSIAMLKGQVKQLEDKAADADKPGLLPTWAWILLGAGVGVTIERTLHK